MKLTAKNLALPTNEVYKFAIGKIWKIMFKPEFSGISILFSDKPIHNPYGMPRERHMLVRKPPQSTPVTPVEPRLHFSGLKPTGGFNMFNVF
jgi:hypothetical protein